MIDFLSEIKWQDVVTALSIVFGLISLIAYLDQRKSNKVQQKYLDFVNRQLDRDITKEEVETLKDKKTALTLDIENKLPLVGRTAVLQDQAAFYQKGIYSNYEAFQEVQAKLGEIEGVNIEDINPDLKEFILKEVSPQYRMEQLITQTRDRVLAFLALIIVIGIILPFGIDYYMQLVLGIFLSEEILKYMILNARSEKEREKIYKNAAGLIVFTGIGIIGFSIIKLLPLLESADVKLDLVNLIWSASALFGLALFIFANPIIRRFRKKIEGEAGI